MINREKLVEKLDDAATTGNVLYSQAAELIRVDGEVLRFEKIKLNAAIKTIEKFEYLREALKKIAEKSICACWDVPGMGSGYSYKWIGCPVHNSDDPEEWCMCCIANEALNQDPSK